MKKFIAILFFLLTSHILYAQNKFVDSLKSIIKENKQDTTEVDALYSLGSNAEDPLTGEKYASQGLTLSKNIKYRKGEANCNFILADAYNDDGNIIQSLQYGLNALDIYSQLNDVTGIASSHLLLQANYRAAEDFNNALLHEFEGEKIAAANNVKGVLDFPGHRLAPLFLAETAQTYILMNQPDSGLIFVQQSIRQNELFNNTPWGFPFYLLATIQQMKGDYHSSIENYRKAKSLSILNDNPDDTLQIYSGMSTLFKKFKQYDSSLYYAREVFTGWDPKISETKNLLEAVNNLYEVYEMEGLNDSTLKYLSLNYKLRNDFFSTEKEKQIQEATFSQQLKQEQFKADQLKYRTRLQVYAFIAGLLALLIITGLQIRNNRHNKRAKLKIENAYSELKSTQAQLIQSEKMASLGELTAGIAHEIQNPLNFVNNFSEVNQELLVEMKDEIKKGNMNEADAIADNVISNEEKISHHGKRAGDIVKGMLQHSQKSSGQKEPTDINALADEYLRLGYLGLRAKDKSFNATMKTDFDNSIGQINIVPQDIGKVILNLINNAFYAVNEKLRAYHSQVPTDYKPTVTVRTKKTANKIEIKVMDNGTGIPEKIKEKIFQPFFTTKPAGEGTGLGLSLSYDIIKAHGGELKVETEKGEGSEFIIQLPIHV
jgi:two-component system, NtrC family, sensor kinase